MRLKKYLLIMLVVIVSCEQKTNNNSAFDTTYIDSIINVQNKPATNNLIGKQYDSLIVLYNSLPEIKKDNFYFDLGKIKNKKEEYYVWFRQQAELGNPDSAEAADVDRPNYHINFGRGYVNADTYFLSDSKDNFIYSIVKLTDANTSYGEEHSLYVLRRDSKGGSWKDVTNSVINKTDLFEKFSIKDSRGIDLKHIFYMNYNRIDNKIVLKVNKARKHVYCQQEPKDLICQIKQSQLDDSLVLEWSLEKEKYIVIEQ